jgi:DNA-binding response OmpR family regulator
VLPQLRAGIHFLPKPYSMSELLDAIRLCFRHAADATLIPPPHASAA